MIKQCSKCKEFKTYDNFGKNSKSKDGLKCCCKNCRSKEAKDYANNNPEKIYLKNKKWAENNKDKNNAYSKKWFSKNKEKAKDSSKKWRDNNPEQVAKKKRQWRINNPDYDKEYFKNKKITDPIYKLTCILRGRINSSIKQQGTSKGYKSIELLGCTGKEAYIYLESLFEPGMTWNNHGNKNGQWEIDHIIPCSLFDLTDPEEQKKCFHYTNLQPLWREDNRKKYNKII